jgi:hypothetical protein
MSAPDSLTTRLPNGVTNASSYQTMAAAGIPDPSWAHVYHNDFDTYAAGDWTVTKVGTGTVALAAVDGGQLLSTTTAGATDAIYNQLTTAGFKLLPGRDTWLKFAGILADVSTEVFYCGLVNTTTTPLAPTDGIYISKAAGVATLTLNIVIGSVTTTVAFPAAAVLTAGVAFELGLHVDYLGNVEAFWNPSTGADWGQVGPLTSGTATIGARGHAVYVPNANTGGITQVLLNPSFGILNASAAAHTLGTDYITVVRNR